MGRILTLQRPGLGLTVNLKTIEPGNVFHYTGYEITIQSVGTQAAPFTGLQIDEGGALPVGTIYTITSGAGAGEVWQTTGPNTAVQIVTQSAPPSPSSGGAGGGPAAPDPSQSGAAASITDWFSQSTDVFGTQIPNAAIAVGAAVLVLGIFKRKR